MEILHEGKKILMCKVIGHKYQLNHQHFVRKDKDGLKETFTCYICTRCNRIKGALAHKEESKHV